MNLSLWDGVKREEGLRGLESRTESLNLRIAQQSILSSSLRPGVTFRRPGVWPQAVQRSIPGFLCELVSTGSPSERGWLCDCKGTELLGRCGGVLSRTDSAGCNDGHGKGGLTGTHGDSTGTHGGSACVVAHHKGRQLSCALRLWTRAPSGGLSDGTRYGLSVLWHQAETNQSICAAWLD